MADEPVLAEVVAALNGLAALPSQVADLRSTIENNSRSAREDRQRIINRQDVTNGRLRDVEIDQAKLAGGINVMKWVVGIALSIPGVGLAIGGIVLMLR